MHDQFDDDLDPESPAERLVRIACGQFKAPCGLISLFGEDKTSLSTVVGLCADDVVTDMSPRACLSKQDPGPCWWWKMR